MTARWLVLGIATGLLGAGAASGASPGAVELVKDLAPGINREAWSYSGLPVAYRGLGYFGADDGYSGYEMWVTDGTRQGTRMFADLCPGRCAGDPSYFLVSGDLLYFIAGNTTGGYDSYWLWRSDGTRAGTFPLVDMNYLGFGSAGPPGYFAPFQGGVVFLVHNRVRQAWDLWRSDGTLAGTRGFAPLPGKFDPADAPFNREWPVQDTSDRHYFSWQDSLWVTDGSAEGTQRVATTLAPCSGGAFAAGHEVFAAEVERRDCEPWVSDGTPNGAHRLRDIVPGEGPSYPGGFVAAGSEIYFTAFDARGQRHLWKSDGTTHGTVPVRAAGVTRALTNVQILATAGSRLYFSADDGAHGSEIWRTDGTPESTVLVADLSPGTMSSSFFGGFQIGDTLYFTASGGSFPTSLWRTRGSGDSTIRLIDYQLDGGSSYGSFGGRLYFAGTFAGVGSELGVSDGTIAGTGVYDLAHPARSADPGGLLAAREGLLFTVDRDGSGGLWHTVGAGVEPLSSEAGPITEVWTYPGLGGAFYTTSSENRFGWTDGRTARDLVAPEELPAFDGLVPLSETRALFFAERAVPGAGVQLWTWGTDGTPEGTEPLAPADPRTSPYSYTLRVGAVKRPESDEVAFLVQDVPYFPEYSSNLKSTAGNAAPPQNLVHLRISRHSYLGSMFAAGSKIYLSFWDDFLSSLWVSGGTPESTREIYRITNPFTLSFIENLTVVGDRLYWVGDDFEHGREVWVSDGTPEGTHRVADLRPGPGCSDPSDLSTFGDRLLFSADDGIHGRELWLSDGTSEGTRRIEIRPGVQGSYPQAFQAIGDRALFAADDGIHGLEVWVTDGTSEGTHLVADVMPGPLSGSPRDFEQFGDDVYMNAGRRKVGYELFRLPLSALDAGR